MIEKFEHFDRESSASVSATFDIQTGEVQLLSVGLWSVSQANAFFADWKAMVGRIHAAGRSVFALVDLSDNAVQQPEVTQIVAAETANIYIDGDALATLVPTSLATMQMRRVLHAHSHEFFVSRSAAEAWLNGRRVNSLERAQL